jgi:cobyric acid synthase
VTSDLIRKGIEEGKINAELRAEIEQLKQRNWHDLTGAEVKSIRGDAKSIDDAIYMAEAKLKEKNT